jgi:hypothetical protein
MRDVLMLCVALAGNVAALAWFALAMPVHWRQVRSTHSLTRRTAVVLRTLGMLGLVLSFCLCLRADHASMAVLVWIMSVAGAALAVAFTLAWRPRMLAPLIVWSRGG